MAANYEAALGEALAILEQLEKDIEQNGEVSADTVDRARELTQQARRAA